MLCRLLLSAQYKKDQEILNVGFNQMFSSSLVMGRVDYCNSLLYGLPRNNINNSLWERRFGRGRTSGTILWTCLIAAKKLSSYLTREDKSFTPLMFAEPHSLYSMSQSTKKNSVISWQCLKICVSSMYTCLEPNCNIAHKWLQPGEWDLSQLHWYWYFEEDWLTDVFSHPSHCTVYSGY